MRLAPSAVAAAAALLLWGPLSLLAADNSIPDSPGAVRAKAGIAADSVATSFDIAEFRALHAPAMFAVAIAKPKRKVLDKKFLLLAGLGTGLTILDYELTQRCLAAQSCVEADPLLPHSRAGMYATNIPLNLALFWWSYRRKADGKRLWWMPSLAVAVSHAVGVGSNLRIQ